MEASQKSFLALPLVLPDVGRFTKLNETIFYLLVKQNITFMAHPMKSEDKRTQSKKVFVFCFFPKCAPINHFSFLKKKVAHAASCIVKPLHVFIYLKDHFTDPLGQ